MTAFWLNLLLLPTYDLPAESELDRFPPKDVAEEWSWVAWNHAGWAFEFPERYPAQSWRDAEKRSWMFWKIACAWKIKDCMRRRLALKELRETMPAKWWRCPAQIEIVPYALIPNRKG